MRERLPERSLSVNKGWGTPSFCVTEGAGTVTITTARIKAKVSTSNGGVSYADLNDKPIVAEDSKSMTPTAISGTSTNKVQAVFTSPAGLEHLRSDQRYIAVPGTAG